MKKLLKITLTLVLTVLTLLTGCLTVFAESSTQNGWVTQDGKTKYYENGTPVTGIKTIGYHTYYFDSDGNYVSLHDEHSAIGALNVMSSQAYKDAVSNLPIIAGLTLDQGTYAGSTQITGEKTFAASVTFSPSKSTGGDPYIAHLLGNYKSGNLISRGDGNYAYSGLNGNDTYFNLNIDKINKVKKDGALVFPTEEDGIAANANPNNKLGTDIVVEAELKISEDFNSAVANPFIYPLYRYSYTDENGQSKSEYPSHIMMRIVGNGYVYATGYSSSQYLFKLSAEEFTRISIAIHPASNTYDVYVNGVMVAGGLTYWEGKGAFVKSNYISEFRFVHSGSNDSIIQGSTIMDNVYCYQAEKPVCLTESYADIGSAVANSISTVYTSVAFNKSDMVVGSAFTSNTTLSDTNGIGNIYVHNNSVATAAYYDRGNNNVALKFTAPAGENDSYIKVTPTNCTPDANDFVFDAEFALGSTANSNLSNFFMLVYRNDANSPIATTLLSMKEDGTIYTASKKTDVCKLSVGSFKRISVVLHKDTNTFDVYVNGEVAVSGETITTNPEIQGYLTTKDLNDIRIIGGYQKDVILDNVYCYEASEPAKNGATIAGLGDLFTNSFVDQNIFTNVTFKEGVTADKSTLEAITASTAISGSPSYLDTNGKGYINIATKNLATGSFYNRGNGDLALRLESPTALGEDSYFNIHMTDITVGGDVVFDAEFAIGENSMSYGSNMLKAWYRYTVDGSKKNTQITLLSMDANGNISADGKVICKLKPYQFVRFSIAIHQQSNTFDVYVNGEAVAAGLQYATAGSEDIVKTYPISEFRAFYSSNNAGKDVMMDNVYVYEDNYPVCITMRNGVYQEGSVLRYYKDNKIQTGSNSVAGFFYGHNLENNALSFMKGYSFIGSTVTVNADGKTVKTYNATSPAVTLPSGVEMKNGKQFVAWNVTVNGNTFAALPGAVIMAGSYNVTLDAIGVDIEMLDGASVSTNGDSTLRFIAKISKADYDNLVSLGLTVKRHILVTPTSNFDDTYGYRTTEALETSGHTDYVHNQNGEWYLQTNGYYYLSASTPSISIDDASKKFSAVAYLEISDTYGNTATISADYSDEDNSRALYEVAHKAYNDRVSSPASGYIYNVGNSYSSYSSAELATLKTYCDKVAVIKVDENGPSFVGNHYTPVCTLSSTLSSNVYSVTLSNASNICAVEVNGKLLESDEYTVSGSTITFRFDMEKQDLTQEDYVFNTGGTWYLAHPNKESKLNGTITASSAGIPTAPNGESKFFIWENMINTETVKNTYKNLVTSSSLGYDETLSATKYTQEKHPTYGLDGFDMTDWSSLEFYVYFEGDINEEFFHFRFQNTNKNTTNESTGADAVDYYGTSIYLNRGWNHIVINKSALAIQRAPYGWDCIQAIMLQSEWGSYKPDPDSKLYFTSMKLHKNSPSSEYSVVSDTHLTDSATFAIGGFGGIVDNKFYETNPHSVNANSVAFIKDGLYYLPTNIMASAKGTNAAFYKNLGLLEFTMNGSVYKFREGNTYTVGGSQITLKEPAIATDSGIYLSIKDTMSIFGYSQYFIDGTGLVALSDTANLYDSDIDSRRIDKIIRTLTYVRPTGDTIVSDAQSHSGLKHPYLLMNAEGFKALNYYEKLDKKLQSYVKNLEAGYGIGTGNFKDDPIECYLYDGIRFNSGSDAAGKLTRWALLYQLYDEADQAEDRQKIVDRTWKELENMSKFVNWHPSHYLDTAGTAYGVAIAYDWMYDAWTAEQRATLEGMLYGYALKTTTTLGGTYGLGSSNINWNGVTNGGIMTAALALLGMESENVSWRPTDYVENKVTYTSGPYTESGHSVGTYAGVIYKYNYGSTTQTTVNVTDAILITTTKERVLEDVKKVVGDSITAIEKGMWLYAPDGGYPEGPGYWSYGTTYIHYFLSCLDTVCGTNYGVYETIGLKESAYFTTYLGTGSNVEWGFHDGNTTFPDGSALTWFALKADDVNLYQLRHNAIENGWTSPHYLDILYYTPHFKTNSVDLDKDAYFSLDALVTFRDSWDKDTSLFAGLHGGTNDVTAHSDLDIGNFVISVNGIFIIDELGSDSYNVEKYFGSDGGRWCYYRKRAEGQNTLVMRPTGTSWNGAAGNPSDEEPKPELDQLHNASSKVIDHSFGDTASYAVIDMAPAYTYMTSGKRGLYFKDNRSVIVIQDEATFSETMDIWWFAHTQGNITILDGGRKALIERNGLTLYAELIGMDGAVFAQMAAESLDQNYVGDKNDNGIGTSYAELSRENYRKLYVKLTNVTSMNMAVAFKVIPSAKAVPTSSIYSLTAMSDWTADTSEHNCSESLYYTPAVPSDCISEGNSEYYECNICGKFYSDSTATAEIAEGSWVTAKAAHTASNGYVSVDSTNHTQLCELCDKPLATVAPHRYELACSTTCLDCGYVRTVPSSAHVAGTAWYSDGTSHYNKCVNCDKHVNVTSHSYDYDCSTNCNVCSYQREDAAAHVYQYGCSIDCSVCGYQRDNISHTADSTWHSDGTQHYNKCVNCQTPINVAEHAYQYGCSTDCSVCGYQREASHVPDETWYKTSTKHYRKCTYCKVKVDEGAHTYDYECSTACNACGRTRTATHTQSEEWYYDDSTSHYKKCIHCATKLATENHSYTAACSTNCDKCEYLRNTTTPHNAVWSFDNLSHTKTCSLCQTVLESGAHVFSNYVIDSDGVNKTAVCDSACGASSTVKAFKFAQMALTLYNDISVHYRIEKFVFDNYTNVYAIFTLNDKSIRVDNFGSEKDGYYVYELKDIPAHCMGDTITATLYGTYNDQQVANTQEVTIKDYCMAFINGKATASAEMLELMYDVLNYGAAAQNYAKYKTDDLVNKELSADIQNRPASIVLGSLTSVSNNSSLTGEVKFSGVSISTGNEMRFMLNTNDATGLSVKIQLKKTGTEVTVTDFETIDNSLVFYFTGLSAAQMSDTFTFTVYRNGVAVSGTLEYSIESFAYSMNNSTDDTVKALMQAMMMYGNSAKALIE